MPLTDFINSLNIQSFGYNLYSNDFGEVDEVISNKFLGVKFLQRPGRVTNCLVLGNYFPVEKDQGILFFVSKSNYPCFYPLFNVSRSFDQPQSNSGDQKFQVIPVNSGIKKLSRKENIDLILKYCKSLQVININQIAFILGSCEWESGFDNTIDNQGEKQAKTFGNFWGRGLPQITTEPNYIKYGKILNQDFIKDPELVKNADYSAFILVQGMMKGIFTGLSLDDFITSDLTLKYPETDSTREKKLEDTYYQARQILSGRNRFSAATNVQQLSLNWRKKLLLNESLN